MGSQPPESETFPEYVQCLGFVSKSTREGKDVLKRLFLESHILLLPSLAECCAVVLAEAHAFAVPCATTQVGGNSTIVQDGVTGKLFNLEASPTTWAEWLCEVFNDADQYNRMALAAFDRYENKLNWRVAGQEVCSLIRARS